jgi:hypothetical protein
MRCRLIFVEGDMKRIGNSICAALLVFCSISVVRAVPRLVHFSGTLTDASGKALTGVVGVTFSLYDAQEGGSTCAARRAGMAPASADIAGSTAETARNVGGSVAVTP